VHCKNFSSWGPGFVSWQGQKSFYYVARQGKFWCAIIFLSNGYLDGGSNIEVVTAPSFFRELGSIPGRGKKSWPYITSRSAVCCHSTLVSNIYLGVKLTTSLPFWRRYYEYVELSSTPPYNKHRGRVTFLVILCTEKRSAHCKPRAAIMNSCQIEL